MNKEVPRPLVYKVIRALEKAKVGDVITSSGLENIPDSGAAIFAANHRSDKYDARALGITIPRPFYIPAKKELNDNKLKGWAMAGCGALFFDRDDAADRKRVLAKMGALLSEGHMLGIFPEGTSKTKGPVLRELDKSPAILAARQGITLIPVGIGGTELAEGQKPEHIHIACGEPIPFEPATDQRAWPKLAREISPILQTRVQEMFDFAREQSA